MRKQVVFASKFKSDYKKRKKEKDIDDLLRYAIDQISIGVILPKKFRDHLLKGGYFGCRECHLKPDLLLIYIISDEKIQLVRLGKHSELFD